MHVCTINIVEVIISTLIISFVCFAYSSMSYKDNILKSLVTDIIINKMIHYTFEAPEMNKAAFNIFIFIHI